MELPGKAKHPQKALFQELRKLDCDTLWSREASAFEQASSAERARRVAVIRAVGVVLGEAPETHWRDRARPWVRGLLEDPSETVRRYAITALPRLGSGPEEENRLLRLRTETTSERERQAIDEALAKIGGRASLAPATPLAQAAEQKIRARLARDTEAGAVRLEALLAPPFDPGLVLALRCREGLEEILAEEVAEHRAGLRAFRPGRRLPGLVELRPEQAFTLREVFALRCFDRLHLVLGTAATDPREPSPEAIAEVLASPPAQAVWETFTEGPWRYRLEFVGRGHQRRSVQAIAEAAYGRCPRLLNDPREAPWTVCLRPRAEGMQVELTPHARQDPRFIHCQGKVAASSHPPLAAALARLAGEHAEEVAWDPFCGSGQELIERARRGGLKLAVGSDLSAEALEIAARNWEAAGLDPAAARWVQGDFRAVATAWPGGAGEQPTLILTNPPLGRRVKVDDLRELLVGVFTVAHERLPPTGRLVLINPFKAPPPTPGLRRRYRRRVDLGGPPGWIERYTR
jgi:23S rRNA G2445 N2-methylase RlmL